MSTHVIPIFDPQGVLRDVPQDSLPDAVKAGGMPAVKFMAPDKSVRFVPANRTHEAYQAGGTILPFEDQGVKHPGFWASLVDDVKGMARGAYHAVTDDDPLSDPNVPDAEKNALVQRQQADAAARIANRRAQGHGWTYANVSAPANEMLGVNVEGMEKSAAEGDTGGVLGHAAAVPVTAAASDLAGRAFSAKLARSLEVAPEDIAPKKTSAAKTPKPERWDAHDATGENRQPFAGGMDEWTPKPAKTLADLDPATVARKAAAKPKPAPVAAAPKPAPTPQPVAPAATPFEPSGDPLLDRLRDIAAKIQEEEAAAPAKTRRAKSTEPRIPDPEEDLVGILQDSLKALGQRAAAH